MQAGPGENEGQEPSNGQECGGQDPRHGGILPRMNDLDLTDDQIDAALERARLAVCSPLEDRCYAFSYGAEHARTRCTPQGRCCIGWVQRDNGREAWEAWLDLRTGEGRLRVFPDRGRSARSATPLSRGGPRDLCPIYAAENA
jgi:hypothetical protein